MWFVVSFFFWISVLVSFFFSVIGRSLKSTKLKKSQQLKEETPGRFWVFSFFFFGKDETRLVVYRIHLCASNVNFPISRVKWTPQSEDTNALLHGETRKRKRGKWHRRRWQPPFVPTHKKASERTSKTLASLSTQKNTAVPFRVQSTRQTKKIRKFGGPSMIFFPLQKIK